MLLGFSSSVDTPIRRESSLSSPPALVLWEFKLSPVGWEVWALLASQLMFSVQPPRGIPLTSPLLSALGFPTGLQRWRCVGDAALL